LFRVAINDRPLCLDALIQGKLDLKNDIGGTVLHFAAAGEFFLIN
jgi:hypothetical protein